LPVGLRCLACPRGSGEGRRPAPHPPRPCPTAAVTLTAQMACVSARRRSCGPCIHHWVDPPIQNRRIRRCGGSLEPVPLQRASPVRPAGSEHGPRCLSQPWVPSPHHVGVRTCAVPPVLQGCGVVQRQPGADAMIETSHLRASRAEQGGRGPRALRKSALTEKTARCGGGWAIMPVDVEARVVGQRRRAGQATPPVAQHAGTRLRLAVQTLSENCMALACTHRLGERG
jgi:hypothetical protein